MVLLQKKAHVEYSEPSRAVYILYVHVIPCGSWSRSWGFFRIVRMGLKSNVVEMYIIE